MKRNYIKGQTYMSTSHGLVTYEGLDYYGETSMMFLSPRYGMQYWSPRSLPDHFEEEREDEPATQDDQAAKLRELKSAWEDLVGGTTEPDAYGNVIIAACDYDEFDALMREIKCGSE